MQAFYNSFLNSGMVVCAIMIILWLFRIKKWGATAYLMSTAFAVLGILIYCIKLDLDVRWLIALGVLLGLLLIMDIGVRLFHQSSK